MQMIFTVYILYSIDHDKCYTGFTSNLVERLKSHNALGNGWTKSFRPWIVIYCEYFDAKQDAAAREKQLKSGKEREKIREALVKQFPELGYINL